MHRDARMREAHPHLCSCELQGHMGTMSEMSSTSNPCGQDIQKCRFDVPKSRPKGRAQDSAILSRLGEVGVLISP